MPCDIQTIINYFKSCDNKAGQALKMQTYSKTEKLIKESITFL